ncbi:Probable Co/Zn/Cd efflux system membrane fusion protein [hydrothermal vent metagenome]|uniref:Probable Co/Zn/Cd efflux system membrane fusion protein n=1 Tax=hydrothermal vent metagenome TaxID=652676 RepID=A0A3B0YHZ2_9ZZZZ
MLLRRSIYTAIFIIVLFGLLFGTRFWQFKSMAASRIKPPPPTVSVETVQTVRQTPKLTSVGTVVATHDIGVTTEVGGIIRRILFKSGDKVTAGMILVKLDDRVDQAALLAKKSAAKLAEIQYKRSVELLSKRLVSNSSHDEVRASFEAARAEVTQQLAIINQRTITAPFTGFLGIRNVNLGQYLKPGDKVVTLQTLNPIYIDYSLPERYFSKIKSGLQVIALLDAFPGQKFVGKINAIQPGIDSGSRTIKVRAIFNNKEDKLRPGMFAEIITLVGKEIKILTIPRAAVSFNTYGNYVFILSKNKQGKLIALRKQVTLGRTTRGRVTILKGINLNDQVVVAGYLKLRNKLPVSVNNTVKLKHSEISSE